MEGPYGHMIPAIDAGDSRRAGQTQSSLTPPQQADVLAGLSAHRRRRLLKTVWACSTLQPQAFPAFPSAATSLAWKDPENWPNNPNLQLPSQRCGSLGENASSGFQTQMTEQQS